MRYAEILFPQKVGTLTYAIPENLNPETGHLVKLPLRKKSTQGLVLEIHNRKPDFKTSPIEEILLSAPLLPTSQIQLLQWLSTHYFCPLSQCLKLFVPKRIFQNKPVKSRSKKAEQINRTPLKKLTPPQDKIFAEIKDSSKNNFLIHGITGSGKTEIYTRLAEHYIKQGKQVLILVPEISLTPQIIEYFESGIGLKASAVHSKISEGERNASWQGIHSGEIKLIIGSRSAVFAPFQNLGLIIVDEEHDSSYKQDKSPRYSTHRVIEKIQNINPQIKVVYGSATPSVETAIRLKDTTLRLESRISGTALPDVEIVDLREEFHKHNYSIFSERLREEILRILAQKEQAILFLNRRGSASSVVCRDCGIATRCTNCEVPLTYHAKTYGSPTLVCHHCGALSKPPINCPVCKGPNIRYLGIGTQRIEEDLKKEFPEARVLRADKDTTSNRYGFEKIYRDFRDHKADILVGTQMISKGLDIPNVNLVGIVLADIGLNIPDFRNTERNFQLTTQVSGRAGRAEKRGKVIIQTYNPDNLALEFSKTQNYDEFFKAEITQRKLLKNPPFSHLAKILVLDKTLSSAKKRAEEIATTLQDSNPEAEVNSYPAYLTRLRGKFRYIVLIKCQIETDIHKLLENLPKEYIMDPNIRIDIDPITTT
ncbi:MAG: primosomal protein N' [Candidatus Gracilibacteria bacterium]